MTRDDDIEPKLGRIGKQGGNRERTYLQKLLKATAHAGRGARGGSDGRANRFQGYRVGRGAGIGRVLASRDRYAAVRGRRVVIKSRIVKLTGKGLDGARLHLRYIQRDGVTREGEPGALYDATSERANGQHFLERADGDRHQFRFIVSAEDATGYAELRTPIRRLMCRMEEDLGTKLDWVAVDHYNTGHPHTHVVLRGKDEHGRDLVIARDYLAHGMRERAAEIVSFDLGPRTDVEIEGRLRDEVGQERFTGLDRGLLKDIEGDGTVRAATPSGQLLQTLRAGRLQKLKRLGLAEEEVSGRWRLTPNLEETLRHMGERGDIIKTLHRTLAREHLPRAAADCAIYDPMNGNGPGLIGRVIERGLSDEMKDRHYLIIDGVDGRTHYVEVGLADEGEATIEGAIVAITPRAASVRDADRTIANISAANEGQYSVDIHLRHDRTATQRFAETHVRRLEAMRRAGIEIERKANGTWIIAPDHLRRAASYENAQVRLRPIAIEMVSVIPLDQQVKIEAATWLDRELVANEPLAVRHAGFGNEVRIALDRRRVWLMQQGFARDAEERTIYRPDLLTVLRRRELSRAGERLSEELGLPYSEMQIGERIDGIYARRVDLASGRFAMIANDFHFTLVPWRPVLEQNLGKEVAGIPRGDSISWALNRQRQRSGPDIG